MDAEALPQRSPSGRRNRNHDSRPAKIARNGDQTSAGNTAAEAPPDYSTGAGQVSGYECESWQRDLLSDLHLPQDVHCLSCRLVADLDHTADVQLHACKSPDLDSLLLLKHLFNLSHLGEFA